MTTAQQTLLILRLNCGTEILATVSQTDSAYICTDILQIMTDIDDSGNMRLGFGEFMPYSKKEAGFAIPAGSCAIAMPSDALTEMYNKRFSKIITPDTKIIL